MEEKTFELMGKMYDEMKNGFKSVNERIDGLESEIKTVGNQVAIIENELKPKVEIALEGYQAVCEKLQEHDKKFDEISEKIEKQDMEIRVVKAVK